MKANRSTIPYTVMCLAILLIVIAFTDALASGDEITQTQTQSAGDVIVQGDRSRAVGVGFSHGLGDVDINEGKNCYGSESRSNIIFGRQWLTLNPWCAALWYEARGRPDRAASMRCKIPEIREDYLSDADCLSGETIPLPTYDGRDDSVDQAQTAQIAEVSEHARALQQELETLREAVKQRPAARPAAPPEPPYDPALVWSALRKDDDD